MTKVPLLPFPAMALLVGALAWPGPAGASTPGLEPTEFISVFSYGYGQNYMPTYDTTFEQLLVKVKAAGFNVIHTTYTPERLALCKQQGVKMMIDLLDSNGYHIYKNPVATQALAESLRGDAGVWGYNIWNELVSTTVGPARQTDIAKIQAWDPTHPAYSGTYRTYNASYLTGGDALGFYDFHWDRGIDTHFADQVAWSGWARQNNTHYYSWFAATPGAVGEQDFRRSLWSANTAIAFGQKGILWFLGSDYIDPTTRAFKPAYYDVIQVNARLMPAAAMIAALDNPLAVYSTLVTRTQSDVPLPAPQLPVGLEANAFPSNFWVKPVAGEFLAGVFKDPGRDVLYLANNNAYAAQSVRLQLSLPSPAAEIFDAATGQWMPIPLDGDVLALSLEAGGGQAIRVIPEPATLSLLVLGGLPLLRRKGYGGQGLMRKRRE